jgi:hypothetical protein
MCQYCGTKKHRKIYEEHVGKISKDSDGRTFDIHHIDGDHSNNVVSNLTAVSIQDHYDIHYARGDYGACIALAKRMKISPAERAELARIQQLKRSADGTHHFLGGEVSKKNAQKRLESGDLQRISRDTQLKKVLNGTHPFLKQNRTFKMKNPNNSFLLGKFGLEHPKSDKNIYKLKNIATGIVCEGTRRELKKATELSDDALSKLIRGKRKTCSYWELL